MDAEKTVPALNIGKFQLHPECGFLPLFGPQDETISDLNELSSRLPKFIASQKMSGGVKDYVKEDDVRKHLEDHNHFRDRNATMRDLAFITQAFVWEHQKKPKNILPSNLAISIYNVAKLLDIPPILTYNHYVMHNWFRFDALKPLEPENLGLIRNFLGGLDEEWFVLVHVEIEAEAGPALAALGPAQKAALDDQRDELLKHLKTIALSQEKMLKTFKRMPENCDPYIYYHRVRPFIHGWQRNPVIYEGVEEYAGQPQKFLGQTGGESPIVPSLDTFLKIQHAQDDMIFYLRELRKYMPPNQRDFIQAVESGPSVRKYVSDRKETDPELKNAFNASVDLLWQFRDQHLQFAELYIQKQAQASPHNPTGYGTGGTPFMVYLKKHRDETLSIA